MKHLYFVLLSTLALLFFSCKDSGTEPVLKTGIEGNSYYNIENGFKISVPENWDLVENSEVAGLKALLVGTKKNHAGYITPSFNIIETNGEFLTPAPDILADAETNITTFFPDAEILSEKTISINDFNCAELVYCFSYNSFYLQQTQLVFQSANRNIISVTFTSLADDAENLKVEYYDITASLAGI